MSFKTREQAERASALLIMRLGSNWEPDIWENLGWHHSAVLGNITIREHVRKNKVEYCCWIESGSWKASDNSMGFSLQTISKMHTSPHAALKEAIDEFRTKAKATVASMVETVKNIKRTQHG